MERLDGKVAVITGAGRGIGRAEALLLASLGARIVVNDPDCSADGSDESPVADTVVDEIQAAGGTAVADHHPVGSFESAEALMATAMEHFGRVDILVNNAGILRDRTLLKMTPVEWNDVLAVHLTGTFSCLQAAGRIMKQQGDGGRIVNTSSSSGLLGNFGQSNYGAAKAGIYALTRIAAMELARSRVTVNAIAPIAATRMMADLPDAQTARLGRGIDPARIAPVVAWLCSAEAADVSGEILGIEGDRLFAYRMLTTHGVSCADPEQGWTLDEIEECRDLIRKW